MICSFLLPSRQRPEKLLRAINSIYDTATHPDLIQVLIRLDCDDPRLCEAVKLIPKRPQILTIIGVREGPGAGNEELVQWAIGKWIGLFNDDAEMQGKGWDEQLDAETQTCVYQPEIYRLNDNEYHCSSSTGFPFFPNKCWDGLFIGSPADAAIVELAQHRMWPIRYLKGLKIWHDRIADATLHHT